MQRLLITEGFGADQILSSTTTFPADFIDDSNWKAKLLNYSSVR